MILACWSCISGDEILCMDMCTKGILLLMDKIHQNSCTTKGWWLSHLFNIGFQPSQDFFNQHHGWLSLQISLYCFSILRRSLSRLESANFWAQLSSRVHPTFTTQRLESFQKILMALGFKKRCSKIWFSAFNLSFCERKEEEFYSYN